MENNTASPSLFARALARVFLVWDPEHTEYHRVPLHHDILFAYYNTDDDDDDDEEDEDENNDEEDELLDDLPRQARKKGREGDENIFRFISMKHECESNRVMPKYPNRGLNDFFLHEQRRDFWRRCCAKGGFRR